MPLIAPKPGASPEVRHHRISGSGVRWAAAARHSFHVRYDTAVTGLRYPQPNNARWRTKLSCKQWKQEWD